MLLKIATLHVLSCTCQTSGWTRKRKTRLLDNEVASDPIRDPIVYKEAKGYEHIVVSLKHLAPSRKVPWILRIFLDFTLILFGGQDSTIGKNQNFRFIDRTQVWAPLLAGCFFLVWAFSKPLTLNCSRAKSHHIADLLHQTGWADLATRETISYVYTDLWDYYWRRAIVFDENDCTRLNIGLQNEIKYEKLSWRTQDTQSDWRFSF